MNTNILISLDTRRAKKDGSFPIVLRIGHRKRTANISTGYSVSKVDWDNRRRQVKKSFKGVNSVSRLNHRLVKMRVDALDKIKLLEEQDQLHELTVQQIKKHITREASSSSFFVFTQELIEDFRKVQRFGNAQSYKTISGVLRTFCKQIKKNDLQFKEITYNFLKRFEVAHLGKGNSLNSLAVYMRTIRAIYNKAIKAGIIERQYYPFTEYRIQTEPTKKRAISIEDLQKILQLELDETDKLFHYRNYFLASYMIWGISFMDLAFLKISNIVDGRIQYRRKKTAKLYDIRISEQLKGILTYYTAKKEEEEFIFPIIKRQELEDQYKDAKWARKRYNTGLQELASKVGISEKLTSYVARHSFATQALLNEIPIKAISEMLGHSSLSTTEVYLKSLPSNILDDYSDRLSLL